MLSLLNEFAGKFIKSKNISNIKKFKSYNTIFVSSAEVKHTNSKAIITIYIYNRQKIVLQKKIKQLKSILQNLIILQLKLNLIMKRFFNSSNFNSLINEEFLL